LKLGGVSHKIKGLTLGCGAKPQTMIVGADVTHPGKNSDHCPSMAGIVATNDDESNHYLASARLQKGKQEVRHFSEPNLVKLLLTMAIVHPRFRRNDDRTLQSLAL